MNKFCGIGRITKELELKYTEKENKAVVRFNLAINRSKDETAFVPCEAWNKCAENISKYFSKGSQIGIVGHIRTGSFEDKDGKTVYTWSIVVDEFDFVGKREDNSPFENAEGQVPVDDSDLPF
jgi:single-strand DNA-binding protein